MNPLVVAAVVAALAGVGALTLWQRDGSDAAATGDQAARGAAPTPAIIAKTEMLAKAGPRKQANLPPIPFQAGYAPPRSPEIITAAYQFAAEHPEVLAYVPCFCGCEQSGHSGNHDCFVKSRAENGDVIAWDEHGVECAVCIDVANRSRQMHTSGASVTDIRAAIEKEFGSVYPGHTPTPHAPGHATPTN